MSAKTSEPTMPMPMPVPINNTNQIKIGWDIGIKNMSYCQLRPFNQNISTENSQSIPQNIITIGANSYQIAGWEIINVVPKVNQLINNQGEITLDSRIVPKCCAPKIKKTSSSKKIVSNTIINNIELCGKSATHCLINDPTKGFCNTHYKPAIIGELFTIIPETVDICPDRCQCWYYNNNIDGSRTRCETTAVIVNSRNHFIGYCKKHIPSCGLQPGDQLKIIRSRKVASLDLTMLAAALYDELDARPNILYAEDVLLENQPVLKNPTMKTMQTFLYSYYVLHGIQKPNNQIKTVGDIHCYCASNKLDIIKLLPPIVATDILRRVKEVKSGYSRNKKMAVYICQYLLEHGTGCADLAVKFTDKKKQDDLADSLLMTLHFFERANLSKIRTNESKNKSKSQNTNNLLNVMLNDADGEFAERQVLLDELLPRRGKTKLSTLADPALNDLTLADPALNDLTPADPTHTTNITISDTNKTPGKKPGKINKPTIAPDTTISTNILTQLKGKLSVNIDSPIVSDSSLSEDGD